MSTTHSANEPRWRRLPEERPRQILEAALEVFAERGLSAARLEDIARRAGVSKGTIYLYFPNKEELFREVVRSSVIAYIDRAEASLSNQADAEQALRDWMTGYWAWLRSPVFPAMHRLVQSEMHHFPDLVAYYSTEVIERVHRLVCGMIERAMDQGRIRRMDPLVAARMLSSLFITHALWYHQRGSFKSIARVSDRALLDQIRDFFFHAMRPDDAAAAKHAHS
jgi:AcrR family transcriptional regulator